MDREWLYKKLDEVGVHLADVTQMLDVQTRLIEDLNDRVASLEECARVTPMSRRAPRKSQKEDAPCV